MRKTNFKFIDLFAGIGGFHIAMHENGGKCVFASEIDKYARITYKENFKNISPEIFENGNFNEDITDSDLDYKSIPDFDVLCGGFPCQAFSIAGYRKGFEDEKGRGNLFFNILSILDKKKPKAFILENVKNLKTHDKGRTFQTICSHLTSLGYGIKAEVLNSKDYGLHQNRERIYIVGIANCWNGEKIPLPTDFNILKFEEIKTILNKQNHSKIISFDFSKIKKIEINTFSEISNNNKNWHPITINDKQGKYYNPSKRINKYFQNFEDRNDWENFIYNGKNGHFIKAVNFINGKIKGEPNTNNWEQWGDERWYDKSYQNIYQWRRKYVRRNTSGVSPTLTANMGTGGHNVPLIICGELDNGEKIIRKLTPEECFAIQGFSKKIVTKLSKVKIADGQKYKQAGNSVPVNVVKKISTQLIKILNE
ncbi:DNA (cytosine-5-)-methyltransferase [Polaribacter sp. KT 15]|uniref:DNA (cytosine-5-)-methyltransferase n=1 Tax=Polaribacter sp. KT 15 TaxID=1896175 RepID=UPI00090A97FB|nr:DNA (cytosine-5-)-methyltransferase [Polaribacter sp. KT 15]SHM75885.1 DNA (cytosine-5)-methyltransferase 1 [Polaribacter sp. KT 15]